MQCTPTGSLLEWVHADESQQRNPLVPHSMLGPSSMFHVLCVEWKISGNHERPKRRIYPSRHKKLVIMGKKVLILDLDETLVHRESTKQPSTSFLIHFLANGKVVTRYICKRPKVDEFLETLKPFYTIHIFTAGYEQFTNKALDVLDPCGDIFESIFYNDSCTYYGEGIYQKDLTKICADLTQAVAIMTPLMHSSTNPTPWWSNPFMMICRTAN